MYVINIYRVKKAIALPTGFTPEGLPVGIQLVERPGAEVTLMAIASQLESSLSLSHLRPVLH